MLCDPSLFSVPRRRVQSPHGDHPFREQLFRRLVPRRPESSVSCTAHRPVGLNRGSGRMQERLRSQSRQSRYVRPHGSPSPQTVPFFVRPQTSNINLTCELLARNTADSANCCTGSHDTATSCPPSGVQYYSFFSTYSLPPLPLLPFSEEAQRTTARTPMCTPMTRARARHFGHAALR
jgi:hypothetical protein